MHKRIILWIALAISLNNFNLLNAAIIIQDGDFMSENWSTSIFSVNGGSGSSATISSGGSPGAYRQMSISLPNAPSGQRSVAAAVVFRNGLLYNPALLGEVESMSIRLDLARTATGSGAVGWGIAVRQDGEIYISGDTYFHTTSWATLELTGLVASDFLRLDSNDLIIGQDTSSQPDFSVLGNPFEIGFYARNSTTLGGPSYSRTYGYDNVVITVIPEPSVYSLLVGIAVVAVVVRRRKSA